MKKFNVCCDKLLQKWNAKSAERKVNCVYKPSTYNQVLCDTKFNCSNKNIAAVND